MRVRCRICRKPIGREEFRAPDGTIFDSPECLERHNREHELRALRNSVRVMRARCKAKAINRAETVYQELGGQDWITVRKILQVLL
jgi:hypothetical protein